jgi:hypothetical protein
MLDGLSLDERGMLLWSRLEPREYLLPDEERDNSLFANKAIAIFLCNSSQ